MMMMRSTFVSGVDDLELAAYEWDVADPRGVVQVAHGLAEHSARDDRFARALNEAGDTVRAIDHRGHGASIAGRQATSAHPASRRDMAAYGASLRGDVPLFLFAHSMGSFAAQSVILTHSEQYARGRIVRQHCPRPAGSRYGAGRGASQARGVQRGFPAPHRLQVALAR